MKRSVRRRYLGHAALPLILACLSSQVTAATQTEYRRGLHEGFERLVFESGTPLVAEIVETENRLRIRFDSARSFQAQGGARGTGDLLRELRVVDARTVELDLAPGARFRQLRLDADKFGIDIMPAVADTLPADIPAAIGSNETEQAGLSQPHAGGSEKVANHIDDGYRRDLMIQSLLARIEALEGMAPAAGPAKIAAAESGAEPTKTDSIREDLLIDRALERTLAGTGTLLLPAGAIELEPSLSYALADDSAPVFITDIDDVSLFVGANQQRRQSISAALGIRAGLPFDSQLELDLPWQWGDEQLVTEVGNAGAAENDEQGSGVGDLRVGFAKTLYRGEDRLPDLVGRVFWDTATGEREDNSVGLGGGRHEFGGSLSFLKRQDPLAFSGAVSVETSLEDNDVKRGDRIGVSVGAVLAASPHTSLKIGYTHRYEKKTEFAGDGVPGSSRTFGVLSLGAAAVVARRTLLDFTIGVGLGDDAPDVTARLAMPIRFTLD
ncbi:MAG: transporter [Geminicoccaceae bacterium]